MQRERSPRVEVAGDALVMLGVGNVVEPLPLITLRSKYGLPVRLEPVKDAISRASDSSETRKDVKVCPFAHHIGGS